MANTYTTNSTTVPNGGTITLTSTTGTSYVIGGNPGQVLTSSGSNGSSWTTAAPINPFDPALKINQANPPELEVRGRMVINGQDLEERLKTIERVLLIPERDVILEKKYPNLKKKYDEYINTLEKYRTFERIKGDDDE